MHDRQGGVVWRTVYCRFRLQHVSARGRPLDFGRSLLATPVVREFHREHSHHPVRPPAHRLAARAPDSCAVAPDPSPLPCEKRASLRHAPAGRIRPAAEPGHRDTLARSSGRAGGVAPGGRAAAVHGGALAASRTGSPLGRACRQRKSIAETADALQCARIELSAPARKRTPWSERSTFRCESLTARSKSEPGRCDFVSSRDRTRRALCPMSDLVRDRAD